MIYIFLFLYPFTLIYLFVIRKWITKFLMRSNLTCGGWFCGNNCSILYLIYSIPVYTISLFHNSYRDSVYMWLVDQQACGWRNYSSFICIYYYILLLVQNNSKDWRHFSNVIMCQHWTVRADHNIRTFVITN